ncbi:MAG: alpha/beta hydrolase [Desulfosalsimonas sp.]|uniref:alpha/beta hydrolase n=1 Tax=Desulfosalsimonas sp. TaxID=3073848 RepID=UPI003970CEE8
MQDSEAAILDRPEILQNLFHPRKAPDTPPPAGAVDVDVAAEAGVNLGCRFYLASEDQPHLLFFHGNGEIAADYDPVGPVYIDHRLNFLVADYRGYGKSTGSPSVSAMLSDAHLILDAAADWMEKNGRTGPLWVMGRSLGSASALELAAARPEGVAGIVIESGFAHTVSLLQHLGVDARTLGIEESAVFSNAEKIAKYTGPALIVHARFDHIIPLSHGQDLYQKCPSETKALEIVENANHNDIMIRAGMDYFRMISDFIRKAGNR